MSRVLAAVLAAGRSSRMGQPKALLPCPPDGQPFVLRAVSTCLEAGIQLVAVVGREGDTRLGNLLAQRAPGIAHLSNSEADQGPLSSVHVAVAYAEQVRAEALLLFPVDTPLVRPQTVRMLLEASGGDPVVRPVYGGAHGHPVLFAASLFDELRRADPALGARSVVRRDPARVRDVPVDDSGVLRDIDWPEDYRALLEERAR